MYYRCTRDLWSIVFQNIKKFTKDGLYVSVSKDTYINDQGKIDEVSIEGWGRFFVLIDLEEVNINEIYEVLELECYEK